MEIPELPQQVKEMFPDIALGEQDAVWVRWSLYKKPQTGSYVENTLYYSDSSSYKGWSFGYGGFHLNIHDAIAEYVAWKLTGEWPQ